MAQKGKEGIDCSFVKWRLFSYGKHWKLSVCRGAPVADILQNIAIITGFEVGAFDCKRKDGSLIALSSILPTGSELYIEKKDESRWAMFQKNEKMAVFVKTTTEKTMQFNMKPNDTIHMIKLEIEWQEGRYHL